MYTLTYLHHLCYMGMRIGPTFHLKMLMVVRDLLEIQSERVMS